MNLWNYSVAFLITQFIFCNLGDFVNLAMFFHSVDGVQFLSRYHYFFFI